ncbi:MAG: ATP-binding cassette domain-containing protein, partial [Clostridia bacterium]|nr:ATP-binding cassette domain-containing protein [Clostridia bacterium]
MKLEFNRITKSYGSNIAVNEFSAVLTPGVYALLGPNGSGKSTLMNVLTDNLKADSGSITYAEADGKAEDVLKMGVRFREKLGFMPQYPGLYPNFTVERFMWYMAALKGIDKKTAKKQISDILRAVELDDMPHRKIGALSGGMKQRLALAQAVLGDPDILILDEPT